ncbi:hypothetical protein GGQ92_000311 [Gracilibacillus halotolerans]|uniref:Putative membrane protein insertion efficiency factor n=1 Tax=Gracilibacillus halotolerans TaxID=74386 RepID=A0A841RKP6_9BACI|nr:membrane protein insertion efficiency factor YidD [Gracilibacillus halotolerans]MBB6511544.1 hypothetical protein [Gracilibacillus halotolerans]
MKTVAIGLIKGYQKFISPLFPPSCRFYPTCSQYSLQCFREFSFPKATYLTIKRLLKCHPFHPGGIDPIPNKDKS